MMLRQGVQQISRRRLERAQTHKNQRRYFLDALRKKFRQKPVDLSKLYMNDLNIENNMDVDEPRLPQPGESSLVKTYLPFVISSVYDHPRNLRKLAKFSKGNALDRLKKTTLLQYGRTDLMLERWQRDFDEGSQGAFSSVVKAFENKTPLTLSPFCGDMFWTVLKDAWPIYQSMYEFNLRVYDIQQEDKWMNFVVDLPKLPGQERAVYRLASGAAVRYSVPSTKELREAKQLSAEANLETASDMLRRIGMKKWQITEYLEGRPVGQIDGQGRLVPVYADLDKLPKPIREAQEAQKTKFRGSTKDGMVQIGGLFNSDGTTRPVGSYAYVPDLVRRLHNDHEFLAKGNIRSLSTYISQATASNPDFLLNEGKLKVFMNVLYSATHDIKLWRPGKSDMPMFEALDKIAPHFATFETVMPLNPLKTVPATWNLFDIDAFVSSQTSEYRRQLKHIRMINDLGLKGEDKAKAKAIMIHGEKMDELAQGKKNED